MSQVLSIENVGKCYPVYASNFHRFGSWIGITSKPKSEFWANKEVNVTLERGQTLAIIGQNGAGKSTLLKMITGTIRPTTGKITIDGRVSAILELGIGFNPDFTGRENIYHSGGLLGYPKNHIDEFLPSVEDFAEIGEFFDRPTRVYSSGMMARLAFALATAVQPDILIVDEVLSVGDSYFQHKSFDRIRRFREEGTSIILVSHSMGTIRELADRVILLDGGAILRDGLPDEVIDFYNAMIADKENAQDRSKMTIEQKRNADGWLVSRSGSFKAVVDDIKLLGVDTNSLVQTATVGQSLCLELDIVVSENISRLVLGIMIRDKLGHTVYGTNTWHTQQVQENISANEKVRYKLFFDCNLGPGSYSISPALVSSSTHLDDNYEWTDNIYVFDVVNINESFFIGTSFLPVTIQVDRDSV